MIQLSIWRLSVLLRAGPFQFCYWVGFTLAAASLARRLSQFLCTSVYLAYHILCKGVCPTRSSPLEYMIDFNGVGYRGIVFRGLKQNTEERELLRLQNCRELFNCIALLVESLIRGVGYHYIIRVRSSWVRTSGEWWAQSIVIVVRPIGFRRHETASRM
jgi:hypothetical protein